MPKSRKRKSGKLPKRAGSAATGLTGTPKVATLMEHGLEMFHQGDFESAEILFRQVLETSPDHAEAHNMIGVIGLSVGSPDLALGFFETAASIDDKNADYPMNQSIALLDLGEVDRAINAGKIAIDLRPRYAEAWNMLGVAFKAKEDWESARDAFAKTLDINPEYGEAWINLSGILQKLELPEEAIEAGEKGVAYCPQIPEAYYNLAGGFKDALRYSEAIETYGICVDLNPSYYDAHVNLSKCYIKIDEYEQAEKSAQRAIEIDPDKESGYINHGLALCGRGELRAGALSYYKAAKRNPESFEPHTNLGFTLLALEEFSTGWDEYEYGFLTASRGPLIDTPTPVWEGQPLDGRLIHIYGEQGIGDQIMYGTMLQDLLDQGARIIFECEPRLIPLFERAFPTITVIELSQPPDPETRTSDEDYRSSVGSLGRWLRRSVDDFKPRDKFMIADPELTSKYREKYAKLGDGPSIGISWKSNSPNFAKNKNISIELWRPILQTPGCNFVSLQYGDIDADIARAKREIGVDIYVDDDVSAINSLEQSAAQISAVDLVISISNATIHFAGACGVETWMLLGYTPLWHWFLNREDTLWYNSVRCIRCASEGDWAPIIDRTASDLRAFVAERGT